MLFPGDSEIDQLFQVFQKFGTPSETTWPGVSCLPDFNDEFPKFAPKGFAPREVTKELQLFLLVRSMPFALHCLSKQGYCVIAFHLFRKCLE